MARPLDALPKAHLHLHFTGAMRHSTLVELAAERGVHLPDALVSEWPPRLSGTDERGWFRFQRLYDIARSVRPHRGRRAPAAARGGTGRTGRGARAGWRSRWIRRATRPGSAASRRRWNSCSTPPRRRPRPDRGRHRRDHRGQPDQAPAGRADAGQARGGQYAGRGVVGFGLSNDERRGAAADFAPAFRIAARAGLMAVPHGGELSGPASVRACLDELHADRIGHGVAAATDRRPAGTAGRRAGHAARSARRPTWRSGSPPTPADVPLRRCSTRRSGLRSARTTRCSSGARLTAQYELAREAHGLSDAELAELARMSVRGSAAPTAIRDAGCSPVSTPGCRPPRPPDRRNAAQRRPGLSLTMAGAGTAARPEPPGHHGSAPR